MSKSIRVACAVTVLVGFGAVASSQTPSPTQSVVPGPGATTAVSSATMDAEREQIWNSPTMLRARAWVQEYCATSAKISPAEAKQYMTELQNLSPAQMKLWLLKFDHEEATIRQQQAAFNQTRQAGVSAAMGYQRQTQQELDAVNRDENEAAAEAQQSINTQQQLANERAIQNVSDRDATEAAQTQSLNWGWGPYPYGGYGFVPAGYGGDVHIHVHPR
jgi:hypothetical protein